MNVERVRTPSPTDLLLFHTRVDHLHTVHNGRYHIVYVRKKSHINIAEILFNNVLEQARNCTNVHIMHLQYALVFIHSKFATNI